MRGRIVMPRRRFVRALTSQFGEFSALKEYYDRPVDFAREQLRVEPWSRQAEIIQAVADHMRVTVRSGHKIGKSLSAIVLAIWWIATRGPRSAVMMTAPTRRQVRDPLWKEVGFLFPRIRHKLKGPKVLPKDPETGILLPGMRSIKGATGSDPEKMAGISSPALLFIVDEASGIRDEMWEVVTGNMASNARVIAFSNPTRPVGWWADACESKDWHNIHVSSLESPNIIEGADIIPGLAKQEWADWMAREYGVDHGVYKVRVLGQFPDQGDNQIVATLLVNTGQARWDENGHALSQEPLVMGVDPAGKGADDAVIQGVRGNHAYMPKVLGGVLEPDQIAAATLDEIGKLRKVWDRCVVINVDAAAIGLGTAVALKMSPGYGSEFIVREWNGGTKAEKHRRRYDANLRTQQWFHLAKWLKQGGTLPPVQKLRKEILAQTFHFDGESRNFATQKENMRKILKRSPNHADALCLAVHPTIPTNADDWGFGSDLDDDDFDEDEDWDW